MPAKPRYRQLKELIIERISSGELKPSDRVPSEMDLVDSTGVSRMTANRALRELTNEGYVKRVAGVGTFVADVTAASHVLEVRDIAAEIKRRGHRHSALVMQCCETSATDEVAAALECEVGSPVPNVVLVHAENSVPIQLEDRFIAPAFAPAFLQQDFSAITPSAYLSAIAPLQEAEHIVRAQMPEPDVRKRLRMRKREPCLVVLRRTWAGGEPVTFTRLVHPGNRYELAGHYIPPGTETSTDSDVTVLRKFNL